MITVFKKEKAEGGATPTALVKHFDKNNTSTSNQHAIILAALQTGPKTSIQLREEYGVMVPSARIVELRRKGHGIDNEKVVAQTNNGVWHKRIAKYFLVPGDSV